MAAARLRFAAGLESSRRLLSVTTVCYALPSLGGSGFVGQNVVRELMRQRIAVLIYDCTPSPLPASSLLCSVLGDITDQDKLNASLRSFGPTCVIHLASWGMSGAAMLDSRCMHINVEGARVSVEAAAQSGAATFLYMSTYNVVFHGQEIVRGDESTPRSDPSSHTDCYSPSKAAAEELVLAANGRPAGEE
jgi:hypothetical protein